MPKICVAEPAQFDLGAIDEFVGFVLAGGEVNAQGLKRRVTAAAQIAFLRERGSLLGVAGLKRPSNSYRLAVAAGSRMRLNRTAFPFELGWVFIVPRARGRGLSFPLCQALVTAARGGGVFATSRVGNDGMHRTLARLGFARSGAEWQSKQSPENLTLFLKEPLPSAGGALGATKRSAKRSDGRMSRSRRDSDEAYVVSLCDEVLGRIALRQQRFDFLRGDPGKNGRGRTLPVDAYYADLKLVVEYHESQHAAPNAFFDKRDRMTVSGVHRGQQRALYDERRRTLLPQHGLAFVELSVSELAHGENGKLLRRRTADVEVVVRKLSRWRAKETPR